MAGIGFFSGNWRFWGEFIVVFEGFLKYFRG
jgi:hypothetical protein